MMSTMLKKKVPMAERPGQRQIALERALPPPVFFGPGSALFSMVWLWAGSVGRAGGGTEGGEGGERLVGGKERRRRL
jgi:hypothetical protein